MAPRKNAPAKGPISVVYTCPVTAKAAITDISDVTFAPWATNLDRDSLYHPYGDTLSVYCKECEQSHELIEYVSA